MHHREGEHLYKSRNFYLVNARLAKVTLSTVKMNEVARNILTGIPQRLRSNNFHATYPSAHMM